MRAAFYRTLDTLAQSSNRAAAATLIEAIDAPEREVVDGVIATLARRREKEGHLALLAKWHELDEEQRQLASPGRGRMGNALRDALLSTGQLFENACAVAEAFFEYDQIPTLITIAEQPHGERTARALTLIDRLVDELTRRLHTTAGQPRQVECEPIRRQVLDSLERSAVRFRNHQQRKLIDAFVALAGASCETLRTILSDPMHACFRAVVRTLTESNSPGVIHLIFEYLKLPDTPSAIHNVVSRRTDSAFIAALCSFVAKSTCPNVLRNLARIKTYEWLAPVDTLTDRFSAEQLVEAAALVEKSGIKDRHLLDFSEELLGSSSAAVRQAACRLLAPRRGERADALVLRAVEDSDADVQAAATRQLGDRPGPGRVSLLVLLMESPHEKVREAARESLSEFSLENYLAEFDQMDEGVRRNKGALVARIDSRAPRKIAEEMHAPVVSRRLRAIDVAEAIGCLPAVADALVELLADEDHMVRASAADALQFCTGDDVRDALLAALEDQSAAVQNSAKTSLEQLAAADAEEGS